MIKEFFESIVLEKPQAFRGITLFPVTFHDLDVSLKYMTLVEALKKEFITITEVDEGGSVSELKVVNDAPVPVLILDGEELKGAKQNRVVNTSILVPEESEIIIPVTCTERDRWSYNSPKFDSSDNIMPKEIRDKMHHSICLSLNEDAKFASNQSMVWHDIEKLHFRSGTSDDSKTRAMDDIFRKKGIELEAVMENFRPVPGQQGFVVIYGHKVAGFEYLSNPAVYAYLHEKLLKSYIINRLDEASINMREGVDDLWLRASDFIFLCRDMEYKKYPSVGYGFDYRFTSETRSGSMLVHEGEVVHGVFS